MTKEEMEKQIHDFALRINSMGFLDGYAKGLNDRKKEIEKAKREGYDEGVKHGHEDKTSEMLVDTYTQGLNDAWEAAKKIILGVNHGGLADDEIMTMFNKPFTGVLVENTATEVVTKIKEYEKKRKAPSVARACSILEDDCPYDIKCEECEVHCSIERAREKLKEGK